MLPPAYRSAYAGSPTAMRRSRTVACRGCTHGVGCGLELTGDETPERPFSLRSVALAAFLPTLVFSIGEGAIIPIIPIVAHNLGATLAVAGLIAAMVMVGELVGDIPSGWIVSRIGERTAMIGASFLSIVGLITCNGRAEPVAARRSASSWSDWRPPCSPSPGTRS